MLPFIAAIRESLKRYPADELENDAAAILRALESQGYEVTDGTTYAVQRLLKEDREGWKGHNKIELFLAADDLTGNCGDDVEIAFRALRRYQEVLVLARAKLS
jgi:hypothetical protein